MTLSFSIGISGLSALVMELTALDVGQSGTAFEEFEEHVFQELRLTYTLDGIKHDPVFRAYRDLYWTCGMDPTKLRVSSEAVLRRVLRGLNLWRVSDVVDVVNLASAYHRLPIGLVDTASLEGNLTVRTARKGEEFRRIGGKTITCRGREIVVADEEKIVCFGFATHDSDWTKVTVNSENVLLLIYVAPDITRTVVDTAEKMTRKMIHEWVDCELGNTAVYKSDSV